MSKPRILDGALAQKLFDERGSWPEVAAWMTANMAVPCTTQAVRIAAWRWRREQGLPSAPRTDRECNGTGLGAFWQIAQPRPLKVIPDYRSNTTRPASEVVDRSMTAGAQ